MRKILVINELIHLPDPEKTLRVIGGDQTGRGLAGKVLGS